MSRRDGKRVPKGAKGLPEEDRNPQDAPCCVPHVRVIAEAEVHFGKFGVIRIK